MGCCQGLCKNIGVCMAKGAPITPLSLPMQVLRRGSHFHGLTRREQEIAYLVVQGFHNKEIASRCFISELTVKDHLKHIYQKMGIHQRADLLLRLLGISGS